MKLDTMRQVVNLLNENKGIAARLRPKGRGTEMTKYKVNWDNGANACGTFPQVFDTEAQAEAFAEDWMVEMNNADPSKDPEAEGYTAEVIEVEDKGELR